MPVYIHSDEKEICLPRLMIVRGSPGIGKSTVSKAINKINSAAKKTYVSVDAMQHLDLRSPSRNRERLGVKNAALLAASFLEEGFDVVVDYVFDMEEDYNDLLSKIREYCIHRTVDYFLQTFFLDAPLEKVLKRNQSRSGKRGEYMNTALLKKLYAKVSEKRGQFAGEQIIDTSSLSPKQTARTIISCAEGHINGTEAATLDLCDADKARALETED